MSLGFQPTTLTGAASPLDIYTTTIDFNIEHGRYAKRIIKRERIRPVTTALEYLNLKVGDYLFSACRGGPLYIMTVTKDEGLRKLQELRSFSCEALRSKGDKVRVVSRGVLFELDFGSPHATTHFSDTKLARLLSNLVMI